MKTRVFFSVLSLLVIAIVTLPNASNAQRAARGKVQAMDSVTDKAGAHPRTESISGPAKITCLSAVSETPNTQPAPSCQITAPGFTGNLKIGQSASASGAGNVTLKCNGQGYLRCNARIDIPPPSK